MPPFALGFRVKSGTAIAVALASSDNAPIALLRSAVALSDPEVEATRQPYHDGFGTAQEDRREIARLTKIVERCADRAVARLLEDARLDQRKCRGAGLVVGSVIDPATIGNPHIRAHASEGRLFRTVLEQALRARGVDCAVTVEKTLRSHAVKALSRSESVIVKTVSGLGADLDGPWRADEKAAATAAWIALMT